MLIDCPACSRSYHVSSSEIGPRGRTVICPRCETRWVAAPDGSARLSVPPRDVQAAATVARPRVSIGHDPLPRRPTRIFRPIFGATACLAAAMVAIGARTPIVRHVPRLAGLYASVGLPVNIRGLEFATLAPRRPSRETVLVAGVIRNVTSHRVPVPALLYEIRDAQGETVDSWSEAAPARTLGTGAWLSFSSRPHVLPAEGRSIFVRFETASARAHLLVAAATPAAAAVAKPRSTN